MADASDRRRAPRARFSGIALVRAEDFDINCVGGDISESGMLLYPTVPPPVLPTRLRVTFALPNSARWLVIDAELVRAKRVARRTIWAIRFILMSDETREVLRHFIHENDVGRAAGIVMPEHDPKGDLLDLQPLARSSPGDAPGPTQTPSGKVELPELPDRPVEERSTINIEAELPDPETLTLTADEVDQLAAASLLIDGSDKLPPPPPVEAFFDDDEDDEVDTEVRDVESANTDRSQRPPTGPMPPLFRRRE